MKNTRKKSRGTNLTKKYRGGGKNKKTEMKHLRCSPSQKKNKNDFSCFSSEDLYKLRDLWNLRHPDAVVNTNEPKEIWDVLKKNMSSVFNK